MQIGIIRYGAYLPKYFLSRSKIAEAWDFPSIPGTIFVRNYDEDSITMGVEAGLDCLGDFNENPIVDKNSIDGLYFATTTSPYTEKQSAAIIANALDLRKDIITMDIGNSTRAISNAIARAYETIKSEKADLILVIGADMQKPMPESMYEYRYGDGAAALLIGKENVVLSIESYSSLSDNGIGPWKRPEDAYIKSYQAKHEDKYGYTDNMVSVINMLLKNSNIKPEEISKAALYSPDPRKNYLIGKIIGLSSRSIENAPFLEFGNTGNAFALMTLFGALKRGKTGNLVLFGACGDGADAFLLKILDKHTLSNMRKTCRGVLGYRKSSKELGNYGKYLSKKKLLVTDRFTRKNSPVRNWRDQEFIYRFHGMKCKNCGVIQYPIWRACIECGSPDNNEKIVLRKTGKIFTYTLDHLEGGQYYTTPVPRCVIDLDGGGRTLLNMTDVENPEKNVKIGMNVELTFRWMHSGADFNTYYWKCRPIRYIKKPDNDKSTGDDLNGQLS